MRSSKCDIIAVLKALQQEHGEAPSYQQLWSAAASGRIPARRQGYRWQFDPADVPVIAAHFGLTASARRV